MATSTAPTPDEYVAGLPPGRREAVDTVRDVIRRHLPPGYEEGMAHGMIGWYVPLDRFRDTYNGEPLALAALASQKQHMSLYLNNVYGDPATEQWFRDRWEAGGTPLDMGKSCLRFRRVEDLQLDLIAELIGRTSVDAFVARYQEARGSSRRTRGAATG